MVLYIDPDPRNKFSLILQTT